MKANWIGVVLLFDWLNKVQSSDERGVVMSEVMIV